MLCPDGDGQQTVVTTHRQLGSQRPHGKLNAVSGLPALSLRRGNRGNLFVLKMQDRNVKP